MRPRCLDDRRLPCSVATPRPRYGLSILHRECKEIQNRRPRSQASIQLMWPVPHAMAPLRPRGPPSSPPHNTSAHHSRCTRPRTQSITQTKNQTLHFPPLRLAHASGSPMPVVHFSFTTCASHRTASEGLVPLNPTPNLRATGASGRGRWRARADGSHLRPKAASYRLRRGSAQKEKRLGADLSSPERASTRIRFNPSKQAHAR